MRHGLAQRYVEMGIIRSAGRIPPVEEQMPKWLPGNVRAILLKQYQSGSLPKGAQFFPASEPWGSIVAWHGPDEFGHESIQFYQEYPSDLDWYLNFTDGSRSQARLLRKVYTQFNRDMRYFIAQGRSPYSARDEIRRINEEVFKLVIMGAFTVLTSGVGISAINNQMRQTLVAAERTSLRPITSAEEAASSAKRALQEEEKPLVQQATRARALARDARERGDEVVANIGGAGAPHEPPRGINVNNQAVPRRGIPNHVEADGSDIGKLFDPASVDRVEGHNMPPGVIDWERAAPGAYRILRPGGRFEYYWRGANPDAQLCARALRAAGFRDVEVISDVLVKATRP
jgi:hypothetical protein